MQSWRQGQATHGEYRDTIVSPHECVRVKVEKQHH